MLKTLCPLVRKPQVSVDHPSSNCENDQQRCSQTQHLLLLKKCLKSGGGEKKNFSTHLGTSFSPKKKWSPNILRQLACLGRSWPAAPLGWCPPPAPGASAAAPGGAAMVLLALKNQDRSDHGELSEPSRESISMCLSFYGFQCVYLSKYLHNASYLYIFVHSIIHLFAHSGLQSTLPPIWARLCGYKRCVSHSE